jgi:hypothetical protein
MISPKQLGKVQIVSDLATGGVISVPGRIEQYRSIEINQSTAGQTLSLPTPTDATVKFGLDVANVGSVSFVLQGQAIPAGSSTRVYWSGADWVASSPANIYSADGSLTGNRDVALAGSSLEFIGSAGRMTLQPDGGTVVSYIQKLPNEIEPVGANPAIASRSGEVRQITLSGTSSGTATVSATSMTFAWGHVEFLVLNSDVVSRDVAFDSVFFGMDGTTPVGTVSLPPGTIRVMTFQPKSVDYGLTFEWTLIADTDGAEVEASLTAFPVDASASPITITLPAATGSGNIRFYTLRDSTNAATLAVQTGEQLNGVLDGTFAFSDSDVGTQFIATDRAAGRWDVAAVGGSLPLITDATLATGTNSNVASALAVKTYVDNSVATPAPGVATPIGSLNRSVYVVYPMATLPRYFATGSDVQSIEASSVAFTPVTPTSTATALLRAPRTDWTMSGIVAACGIRSTSSPVSMFTGFTFRMRYGLAQGWTGIARHYCGIHSTASILTTNSDPSTNMTDFLMFGWDNADANCQIMIRGAAGAAQKINLGATMPKLSGSLATNTFGFDVTLELPKNAAVGSILKYSVTRLNNGVNVSGEVALTVAPASNTVLGFGSSFIGTAAADRRFSLLGLELSNESF